MWCNVLFVTALNHIFSRSSGRCRVHYVTGFSVNVTKDNRWEFHLPNWSADQSHVETWTSKIPNWCVVSSNEWARWYKRERKLVLAWCLIRRDAPPVYNCSVLYEYPHRTGHQERTRCYNSMWFYLLWFIFHKQLISPQIAGYKPVEIEGYSKQQY